MFGSRNIPIHILRGLLGFVFLAITLQNAAEWGWWALIPAGLALACLGGCPMCWTIGLVMTAMNRSKTGCVDGSCSK